MARNRKDHQTTFIHQETVTSVFGVYIWKRKGRNKQKSTWYNILLKIILLLYLIMDNQVFKHEAFSLVTRYIHSLNQESMTANDAEEKEKFHKMFIYILALWVAEYTKKQMMYVF